MTDMNSQPTTAINEADQALRDASQETQRLLNDAIVAVNNLSNHLAEVSDEPKMYLANQGLRKLLEIQ